VYIDTSEEKLFFLLLREVVIGGWLLDDVYVRGVLFAIFSFDSTIITILLLLCFLSIFFLLVLIWLLRLVGQSVLLSDSSALVE